LTGVDQMIDAVVVDQLPGFRAAGPMGDRCVAHWILGDERLHLGSAEVADDHPQEQHRAVVPDDEYLRLGPGPDVDPESTQAPSDVQE